jgi:MoxR-like ATPase
MTTEVDPVRFAAAAARFTAFFNELRVAFVEREDLLVQVALALLCKEHVLVTGPPGTAKSQLASAVFRRILDEETGLPSLYTRQFTESTVQTDLVGPIDFKTLVETGRTEHFTDEGMLGAVHSFLDEVFDGRDAVLRAALNVLQERELKQGTRTTQGSMECSLMTSNRYISSILETSRQTLLAFVDRIAFVSFVPRGFAEPANLGVVLRRQLAGTDRPALEASLTLQDLDTLQAAVDSVEIAPAVCDGVAAFLEMIDAELNGAVRADPTFIPTRYLSTRTAVRSGRVLRAIAVYDRMFRDDKRPLTVLHGDLAWLRLHLLLSGPTPADAAKLLERETDPEERRQLAILRTEREIFERCWKKLPPIKVPPPSRAARRAAPGAKTSDSNDPAAPPRPEMANPGAGGQSPIARASAPSKLDEQEAALAAATRDGAPAAVIVALRGIIQTAPAAGADAERANRLIKEAVAGLTRRAVHAGLTARGKVRKLHEAVVDLASFADAVDGATPATRTLARWLRGRALDLIAEAASFAPGASEADLEIVSGDAPPGAHDARVEARLGALEALETLRKELYAKGADASNREAAESAWKCAVGLAEDDLVLLLDDAFRAAVVSTITAVSADRLSDVLRRLAPEFVRLDAMAQRLTALRGTPSAIKSRVVGPRIAPLVGAAFQRIDATDRVALMRQIEALVAVLREAGLDAAIAPREWVTWAASALVRGDWSPRGQRAGELDFDGYRQMRASEQRIPNSYTLAEIALRVAPDLVLTSGASRPDDSVVALAALLAQIPDPTRAQVVRFDLGRITRALDYLERWWKWLTRPEAGGADPGEREEEPGRLDGIVKSKFFRVLLDDLAPMRFSLEARIIAEIFPDHAEEAATLRARLESLQLRARQRIAELLHRRADAAWEAALAGITRPDADPGPTPAEPAGAATGPDAAPPAVEER